MGDRPQGAERPVVSARHYTLGPLVSIAVALGLALFGLTEHVWLPLGVLALYWLSLVSVMWETVRSPGRRLTPARAVLLLTVPGLHLVGPLWAIGGYPRAFEEAAREHGLEEPRPSRGAFVAFAVAWTLLVGAATFVLLVRPRDVVALEVLLPPAFLWLPLSLAVTWQASRAVNALAAARAPAERLAAADAEWRRDRDAILGARRRPDPVERAWAQDMLERYAARGVREAADLARQAGGEQVRVGHLREPFRIPVVVGLVRLRG